MEARAISNQIDALQRAVRVAGSQSALARAIGTTQATVWKWLNKGLPITPKLVLAIEVATGISRHDLRPDLYPREPGDDHAPAADLEPAR